MNQEEVTKLLEERNPNGKSLTQLSKENPHMKGLKQLAQYLEAESSSNFSGEQETP